MSDARSELKIDRFSGFLEWHRKELKKEAKYAFAQAKKILLKKGNRDKRSLSNE